MVYRYDTKDVTSDFEKIWWDDHRGRRSRRSIRAAAAKEWGPLHSFAFSGVLDPAKRPSGRILRMPKRTAKRQHRPLVWAGLTRRPKRSYAARADWTPAHRTPVMAEPRWSQVSEQQPHPAQLPAK